jgi:hypothetical protein
MTEKIQEHRDKLRELAESDLPCSWIAETLLEIEPEQNA